MTNPACAVPAPGPRVTDPAEVSGSNAPREVRACVNDPAYCEKSAIPFGKPGRAVRSPDYARSWCSGYRSYRFTPDGSTLTWLVPFEKLTVLEVVG